jgi:hypothetical protein
VGFKTGFIIGAVGGYVLGAKAGRERYDQIKEYFSSAIRSEPLAAVIEKGKGLAQHLPFGAEQADQAG